MEEERRTEKARQDSNDKKEAAPQSLCRFEKRT